MALVSSGVRGLRAVADAAHKELGDRASGLEARLERFLARAEEQVAKGGKAAFDILQDRRPGSVQGTRVQEGFEEGPIAIAGFEDEIRHDVVKLIAGDLAAGPAAKAVGDAKRARFENGDFDARK